MEDTLSIVEAREQLTRLPEQFDEELKTRRNVSAIKVTRHNKPVLAILPWELYESIVETLEILGDEELMADLRQSIQDAAEGKGEPWEAVKRELAGRNTSRLASSKGQPLTTPTPPHHHPSPPPLKTHTPAAAHWWAASRRPAS